MLTARYPRQTPAAMPHANPKHPKRLNPRLPLVFDTRTLGPAAVAVRDQDGPGAR